MSTPNVTQNVQDEYNTPIPEGVSQMPQPSQDEYSTPIPEGVSPVSQGPTNTSESLGEHAENVGTNFAKGAESTVAGISDLIHRIPVVGEHIIPSDGLKSMTDQSENGVGTTADKLIGYGGETLSEFLLGDEVFKGLSMADKFLEAGKVAKLLSNYPQVMKALKLGTYVGKAATELGPEERAAIAKYPTLARMVGLGMDSMRSGAVQAVQSAVRDRESVADRAKTGVEEGAEMGAANTVLGAPLAVAGGLLSKAGDVGKNIKNLSSLAEQAPNKVGTVDHIRDLIDNAEKDMHTKFENGINDLKTRLQGSSVEVKGSPVSQKAEELLNNSAAVTSNENEAVTAAKEATKNRLDTPVQKLLDLVAKGEKPVEDAEEQTSSGLLDANGNPIQSETAAQPETEPLKPWNIDDLITFRQEVRKLADSYPRGDINSRTLKQLMNPVDDTIEHLAETSHDSDAVQDYKDLRADYRDKVKFFEDSPAIKKLQTDEPGRVANDAGQFLTSGTDSLSKVKALKEVIGPDKTQDIADGIFKNWIKDAGVDTETDRFDVKKFDPEKLVQRWTKVPEDVRKELFANSIRAVNQQPKLTYNDLLGQINGASKVKAAQSLAKAGIIGSGVISYPTMGLLYLTTHFMGDKGVASVLDYVTRRPNLWDKLGILGKKTDTVVQHATRPVVAAAVNSQDTKRKLYGATAQSLGGK